MCLKIYGENGKTIKWVRKFLKKRSHRISYYDGNEDVEIQTAEDLVLFWNFGKRYGFGEPDVIVIPKNSKKPILFIEAEYSIFNSNGSIKEDVVGQLERYFYLADAISNYKKDAKRLNYTINSNGAERKFSYQMANIPNDWKVAFDAIREKVQSGKYKIGLLEFHPTNSDIQTFYKQVKKKIEEVIDDQCKDKVNGHFCVIDKDIKRSKK